DARITDLALLSYVSGEDVLLAIDVSDTAASPEGTDKKTTIDHVRARIVADTSPEDSGALAASSAAQPLGVATRDASGQVPLEQLPQIAITETYPVESEAEMLALDVTRGSVAVRTDSNETYILKGDDPTALADWQLLPAPNSGVLTVNGKTGAVTLAASDVGAIPAAAKGTPSGVASLGSDGKVPAAQLPDDIGGIPVEEKGQPGGVA